MGIIMGVVLPFVAGFEAMNWWDERTTDPRLLRMRAIKKIERDAAKRGFTSEEFANKLAHQTLESFSINLDEMKVILNEMKNRMRTSGPEDKEAPKEAPQPEAQETEPHKPEGPQVFL